MTAATATRLGRAEYDLWSIEVALGDVANRLHALGCEEGIDEAGQAAMELRRLKRRLEKVGRGTLAKVLAGCGEMEETVYGSE